MMHKLKPIILFATKMKLMRKLLFSYFALILIPLLLIAAVFSNFTTNFTTTHITFSAEQSFNQTYSFVSFKLHNIRELSNSLMKVKELINILKFNKSDDILTSIKNMDSIISYATSIQDGVYVTRVRIYVPDGLMYSNENLNIFNLNRIKNQPWYKELGPSTRTFKWLPSSYLEPEDTNNNPLPKNQKSDTGEILSFATSISDPNDYLLNIGVVRCDFPKKSLVDILQKADIMNSSVTYIVNSKGVLVATSSNKNLKLNKIDLNQVITLSSKEKGFTQVNTKKGNYLVASKLLQSTDWYMVSVLPSDEVMNASFKAQSNMLIILLLVSSIAIFVAYAISYSLNKRISLLTEKMRNTHTGNLEPIVDIKAGNDEIDNLIEDYNYMTEKMSNLIDEQYKSGQELKSSELKALQAQINPHFLYNTLDMINWYAWNNSSQEIITTVETLAKFYRLSLSKGKDIITIDEEIAHMSSYFQIQKMRFHNLDIHIDISDNIKALNILKITLQPIVENAIHHGILYKETKSGIIRISGEIHNDTIHLIIKDDGVGMNDDKLEKLRNGQIGTNSENGYGLANINKRLQLYYGEEYGLTFESKPGSGTTVIVSIPSSPL